MYHNKLEGWSLSVASIRVKYLGVRLEPTQVGPFTRLPSKGMAPSREPLLNGKTENSWRPPYTNQFGSAGNA
jgi:hypothetical protein